VGCACGKRRWRMNNEKCVGWKGRRRKKRVGCFADWASLFLLVLEEEKKKRRKDEALDQRKRSEELFFCRLVFVICLLDREEKKEETEKVVMSFLFVLPLVSVCCDPLSRAKNLKKQNLKKDEMEVCLDQHERQGSITSGVFSCGLSSSSCAVFCF
jgi:hypothetical protein